MPPTPLTEFCNSILFGQTLEEKLSSPSEVLLNKSIPLKIVPDFPTRPTCLQFNTGKAMKLPSIHKLEDEKSRGFLMHFFLNHELLALEIMALTLLKFPELPDSFKRNMVKTMKEEQTHAKLYLNRMAELGVELGDVFVNQFFWDCLKEMKTPNDFVRGMSLTFEQANLDFSLYYHNAFKIVGDKQTAAIMEKVYREEIGHVSFGLKWFRKWKNPTLSDWQSYISGLEIPLSPARAKGQIFDREGRVKAGFDQEFITNLEVTSFSRGRAPNIYIFNAFTEAFIVQPKGFTRPEWGKQLEIDLSILPIVFAGQDDLLYTYQPISSQHLLKLKNSGFSLPQIEVTQPGEVLPPLHKRTAGEFKPWGWSPEMVRVLQNLINQKKDKSPWHDSFNQLFSKKWSLNFNRFLNDTNFSMQENNQSLGVACSSVDELLEQVKKMTNNGWETVCVKSPFGASGRNAFRFNEGKIEPNQTSRLQNLLTRQTCLLVEPWLNRVADFSAHFEMQENLKFIGITRLLNDESGQYAGSVFGDYENGLEKEIGQFLINKTGGGLAHYYQKIAVLLEEKIKPYGYRGPIGIDAFVYRDKSGGLQFRAVVEINFRMTMGRVALALQNKLASGKCGLFRILSIDSKKDFGYTEKIESLKFQQPLMDKSGKWISGHLLLNEWHESMKFAILVSIGNNLKECELDV